MRLTGAFWRRAPLVLLILLDLGVGLFVGLDLRRRLREAEMPRGGGLVAVPTLIPAPSRQPPTPLPPVPTRSLPLATPAIAAPSILIADDRLSYAPGFYADDIQSFLEEQGSGLARATVSVGQGRDSFARALTAHCLRYGLNPKVLLSLLELQSGAVHKGTLSGAELDWAFGYHKAEWRGLDLQVQWATYLLAEDFRSDQGGRIPPLLDNTVPTVPAQANVATLSLLRLLAYTADSPRFELLRSEDAGSFVATYRDLFGEDPRLPLGSPGETVPLPFLAHPLADPAPISACFDHEYPIFEKNGSMLLYSGERGQQSYDGHDGWDYVLPAGSPVLAAAAGRVVFAGTVDTFCPTPAALVVLDHGRDYRTFYWHLQNIEVAEGDQVAQGDRVGIVGSTGCSSGPHLHFTVQYRGRDTDPFGWCGNEDMPVDPWGAHPAGTMSYWLWADRPSPCPAAGVTVVVDDRDERFGKGEATWYEAPAGYAGRSFWTVAVGKREESTNPAVWRPELPQAGRYFLYAYIPWYDTGRPDTTRARYLVRHASGETPVTVDQAHAAGAWVALGEFSFAAGSTGYVYLDEVTGDPGTTVWFDALVWVRE